ncbi:MAG TPA: hypothetical protein DDZ34_01380 [Syntrophaceae bacterium]|nr:hypothetical protein [Syntrophaceae bacterium]HBL52727.1 hypothetical protein [Syntrophaceae bacterium]
MWCFESFLANATKDEPLECAVNPHLGRECETSKPLINGAKRMVAIIGDARKVGRIAQAVRDGFDTAWKLV